MQSSSAKHPSTTRTTSLRRALFALWFAVLAGASLTWIGAVIVPLGTVIVWETREITQEGQFTFYNAKPGGGFFGMPVELADYDGDGHLDLAISLLGSSTGSDGRRFGSGEVMVYRGDGNIRGMFDRAQATEATFTGLTIWGAGMDDVLGSELYSADVNGDGISDLIIGSQNYDGPRADGQMRGGVFVLLGRPGLLDTGSFLDLAFNPAQPPPGLITISGERAGDRLGIWVEAGDLDGDGIQDLVLGADQSAGGNPGLVKQRVGMAVVIYGRQEFPPLIDLSQGPESLPGVSFIYGRDHEDHFGSSLHCRDLDGDGTDELMVAAAINRLSARIEKTPRIFVAQPKAGGDGPNNLRFDAGEVTILFGVRGERLPPRIDLALGTPPALADRTAMIFGAGPDETAGEEISSGDLDGDRRPEVIIGALAATNPLGQVQAGAAYVFYGAGGLRGRTVDLADPRPEALPPGVQLSRLYGSADRMIFGDTLSVADFNRDGFDDLVIGIPHSGPPGFEEAGDAVVLFGGSLRLPAVYLPRLEPPDGERLIAYVRGANARDNLSYSMEARDYDGDGYDDLFTNAMRGDGFQNLSGDAGEVYVVSGFQLSGQKVEIHALEPTGVRIGKAIEVRVRGCGFTRTEDTEVLVGGKPAARVAVIGGGELTAEFPAGDAAGTVPVEVRNRHGAGVFTRGFTYFGGEDFVRGDATRDLLLDISDPVRVLEHLFLGGPGGCPDAMDADDDGRVLINDPVWVLLFLFQDSPPPPAPFPGPGPDPTDDLLGCP